jgi:8-amino-3,8-dideoxy-alpha-D-manno-octulosonate transaminase
VADPAGDSGPFIIVVFAEPEAAKQFAGAAAERRLSATCLPDYGLHVYYNVKALVEKRSNSTDGFPWTHPANAALKREYGRGSLPRTDELLARAVVIPVPSSLTPEQESQYIAAFRQAHQAAGLS